MTEISYQLYSSRKFPPLSDTLQMLADAGYTRVEGYGGLIDSLGDAAVLKATLDTSGLAMPTGHFGLDAVRRDPAGVIETARTLGIEAVFVPAVGPGERVRDAAGWAAFGRTLAEAGKPLRDAGLAFGWHNHAFEFADLGGAEKPLDLILAGSDDLALEFDVAWAAVGGEDPRDWMSRYGDRIVAAHVKDIAPRGECADEDGWADVGHGTLDWAGLLGALGETSARYLVMEHDNPSDHARFARRSLASVRSYLGAPA